MRLIAISHPGEVPREAWIINRLFREGLECLHIRKTGWQESRLHNFLADIDPVYYPCIALHSHHGIAAEYGIKRIHFPEQKRLEMNDQEWRELGKKESILSTSVHDLSEIKKLRGTFDYCFFSPVFDSISKDGCKGVVNSTSFRLNDDDKPIETIALGGINKHNIKTVKEMNFSGAAVLGALWTQPELAVEKFRTLQKLI